MLAAAQSGPELACPGMSQNEYVTLAAAPPDGESRDAYE